MITQIRRVDDGDPGREEALRAGAERAEYEVEGGDARPIDPYAAAELTRRHERTQVMIRKAHEQFL